MATALQIGTGDFKGDMFDYFDATLSAMLIHEFV